MESKRFHRKKKTLKKNNWKWNQELMSVRIRQNTKIFLNMYKVKHDSVIHKNHNPNYHGVDIKDSDILLLTDYTRSRWCSEINTVNNDIPWQAHSGYYEKLIISKTFEKEMPNRNIIKL